MKPRILVIRGGALGDFVLTLPALGLLRDAFLDAHIELIGYPHIAALALDRYYLDAVRSVDYGPLAGFYAKNGTLDPALMEYFASFQQVVSYLYDPDKIFEENVRKAGVKHYLAAYRKVDARHAALEWASPLESLALYLENAASRIVLSDKDREVARKWLGSEKSERLVIHPGSGSVTKNWPVQGWCELGRRFLARFPAGELIVVSGEADVKQVHELVNGLESGRFRIAENLPIVLVASIIAECQRFAGHDTGIGHVAAGVGARCLLLFGPTDPELWAPKNAGVNVLRAPMGDWSRLTPGTVWREVAQLWG